VHPLYFREKSSFREKFRRLIKCASYRLLGSNPRILSVMTLDPLFPESVIGKRFFGNLLAHLPDPSVYDLYEPCEVLAEGMDISESIAGRRVFLLFGALGRRKGILTVLDALAQVPAPIGRKICVILAGKVSPEIEDRIGKFFQGKKKTTCNGIDVLLLDRYLSNEELRWLVDASDILLAPYIDFVGSSGVLLWAAGAEKPVIAPNYGLLGALVNRYALGEALDTTDSGALAEAMERFVSLETSSAAQKTGMQRFAAASTPEAFCRTFFEFA
jgi:glycosyltransferase involved in cell wall biosynthesis